MNKIGIIVEGDSDEKILRVIINKLYLFIWNWNDVHGTDNERLVFHLINDLKKDWVKDANIEKIDSGKTIKVTKDNNSLELKLNEKEDKVILTTNTGETYEYFAKKENDNLNIYDKLCKKEDYFRFSVVGGKTKLSGNLEKQHINNLVRRQHCNKIIILVDYDNSDKESKKIEERVEEIKKRRQDIFIELCFAKQEIESWLLGCYEELLKKAKNEEPDNVKNPVALLENYERERRKNKNFKYSKKADGKRIAGNNKLEHFEYSASFRNFKEILQKFNKS